METGGAARGWRRVGGGLNESLFYVRKYFAVHTDNPTYLMSNVYRTYWCKYLCTLLPRVTMKI